MKRTFSLSKKKIINKAYPAVYYQYKMTQLLSENLKYLRLRKKWSQRQAGLEIGLNASTISSYENGRSVPKLTNLIKFSKVYQRSIDDIVWKHLSDIDLQIPEDIEGKEIRILPIPVDKISDDERVSLVPVKAAAGYTKGYADAEFVAELPQFSLPFNELPQDRTYRVFQIDGESMLPIPSQSYIVCEYVQNWNDIEYGNPYIIITKEDGIVFKRPMQTAFEQIITLHSDNPEFEPFDLEVSMFREVWKAKGYITFDMGNRLSKRDRK